MVRETTTHQTVRVPLPLSVVAVVLTWALAGSTYAATFDLADHLLEAMVFSSTGNDGSTHEIYQWRNFVRAGMAYETGEGWVTGDGQGAFCRVYEVMSDGQPRPGIIASTHGERWATVAEYEARGPRRISGFYGLPDIRPANSGAARFTLSLTSEGATHELFDTVVPSQPAGWRHFDIDLTPWAEDDVTVRLVADAARTTAGTLLAWSNLVLEADSLWTGPSNAPPSGEPHASPKVHKHRSNGRRNALVAMAAISVAAIVTRIAGSSGPAPDAPSHWRPTSRPPSPPNP